MSSKEKAVELKKNIGQFLNVAKKGPSLSEVEVLALFVLNIF